MKGQVPNAKKPDANNGNDPLRKNGTINRPSNLARFDSLTGYAGGVNTKGKLLELEGMDMSNLFVPAKGTAL